MVMLLWLLRASRHRGWVWCCAVVATVSAGSWYCRICRTCWRRAGGGGGAPAVRPAAAAAGVGPFAAALDWRRCWAGVGMFVVVHVGCPTCLSSCVFVPPLFVRWLVLLALGLFIRSWCSPALLVGRVAAIRLLVVAQLAVSQSDVMVVKLLWLLHTSRCRGRVCCCFRYARLYRDWRSRHR